MKIYEFRHKFWSVGKPYSVEEIEVEEKPKTYVTKYNRISKDSIGQIDRFGTMRLTENNPMLYLEKLLNLKLSELEKLKQEELRKEEQIDKIKKEMEK